MKYCTVCNTRYEDNVSFCPLDGEVLEDDPTSLVNKTLDGQYHIEALLGKGGMGAVFRARHILLGDRVAIKVLPPQMRSNAEWLRRFRREGQAARRFRHPNAVTVYDLRTTSEGLIYMVMEYVEGHTLDAELKARGRLTPLEALNVLEPVMSVLNAAHEMGVVHRDLKPENIMIGTPTDGSRSAIKLLDLGIAKMREVAGSEASGTTALTVAGQILGTPYYMSPEQWGEVPRDGNSEIDGRADIYSLGTVFYELVAGRRPFGGKSLQELRREHVNVSPQPLQEFLRDVPEDFGRAVSRAMSKDRGDRQSTAGELDAELRASLGLAPVDISSTTFAVTGSHTQDASVSPESNTNAGSDAPGLYTRDVPEARNTQSDHSAQTILTLDQPPPTGTIPLPASTTAPPATPTDIRKAEAHAKPVPPGPTSVSVQRNDVPMPTIATNPSAFSAKSQASSPSFAPPAITPSAVVAPRRSPVPFIIGAALLLFLIIGGVGAWFVWSRMNASPGESVNSTNKSETNKNVATMTNKNESSSNSNASNVATDETANAPETMRYWLEVDRAANGERKPEQVAGEVMALHSGQGFKFHFTPRLDGYLYIVGPGDKNVPTTFLTTKPLTDYARTNQVNGGADFAFPSGADKWIELDQTAGTDNFTIVFSPTPLSSPAFLNAAAGHALTAAEQKEFQDFSAQHKANSTSTSVISQSGAGPYVSVKIPVQAATSDPVILDVRIEHR